MPIYEYYCNDCRERFSALRPIAQADASIGCARCDSAKTHRILSLFAFHMSGGGTTQSTSQVSCGCGGGCGCGMH